MVCQRQDIGSTPVVVWYAQAIVCGPQALYIDEGIASTKKITQLNQRFTLSRYVVRLKVGTGDQLCKIGLGSHF